MKLTRRVLHLPAKDCDFKYPTTNHKLANDMVEFMRKEKGIGLAAPQIGIRKRLFVMEVDGQVYHCFNPKILEFGEEVEFLSEGCLSFPGEECKIARAKTVMVRYGDASGKVTRAEVLTGLAARCFQHEFDHLNGITMQQRLEEQHAK